MIAEDQRETIEFLSDPDTYGLDEPVERIDTHGAIVFLAGDRAYKLKRAVKFPYMDYSTRDRRRAMCEAEWTINRRTAPNLYLGVVPVVRRDGVLRLGGDGGAEDWLVAMRRFDQEFLFDRIAARGDLDADLVRDLARRIADFHRRAEPANSIDGCVAMTSVAAGLTKSFEEVGEAFVPGSIISVLNATRAEIAKRGKLLDRRAREGWVRRCHGDLHLRNVCLIDGRPTIFDAIEFDERIATIDVLYDFSFLLMDLEHRNLRPLANAAMNEYLARIGGYEGLALLPLFLALRAAIRALVTATAAFNQTNRREREARAQEARAYLAAAERFFEPVTPRVVSVGGLSGSGKTTVARAIAPMLGRASGAAVLRSDEIRKELMGVDFRARLPQEGYTPAVSERVYATMFERAAVVAETGQAVVMDAVFNRADGRRRAAQIAGRAGLAFTGLWLEAPRALLEGRVERRRNDASDADAAVVRAQLRDDPGGIEWNRINASGSRDAVVEAARAALAAGVDANQ